MLLDFDLADTPVPGHTDVCIVGAGAAGILLATQLAAAGRTVTLLEGGGRQQEARSQEIYRSEVTGLPHNGIHLGRFRTYGGTTTQWGGQILELDDFDFEPRSHVPGSGWPIHKSELVDYYERALCFAGLRRVERQDDVVRQKLGLEPIDAGAEFKPLYSRWVPERNFAELHRRTLTDTRKLKVYVHASVVGFELNEARSAIDALDVRSFGGRQARVTADTYILCMGGIETTRLLLQPLAEGLAPWRANGLLGRYYQDHIGLNGIAITGLRPQPASRYFGYVTADGFRYHRKIQLALAEQAAHGILNVAATIAPFRTENQGREKAVFALRTMLRDRKLPSVADALRTAIHVPGITAGLLSQRLRGDGPQWKQTMLPLHCEQSPLSASTITLSGERDELGLFRTRLNWVVSDEEIRTLRTFVRIATSVFEREGFAKIHAPKGFFEDDALVRSMCGDSNHHIGGTRMASSPVAGIVDANLKLHGIANGYVCSSSVFPCSGFSNPTHTLLALGMRLADLLSGAAATQHNAKPAAAMRTVLLPGSGKSAPQLAFGCAYLLGPGLDRIKSRRLLDAAYDAGVRHFDVARLYGQGRTEALLGEFLAQHSDCTVTTKYGLIPPNSPQRIAAALGRRVPQLKTAASLLRGKEKARFDAADARASLDFSLRQLRRDHVELLLLHEVEVGDLVHDDLLAFLEAQRTAGKIGSFGIGGEYYRMQKIYEHKRAYTPVLQFEHSIFGPKLDLPGSSRIHYRTFARATSSLSKRFDSDAALCRRWSETVGAELAEPLVLGRILLKAALDEYPESLMLFSTRSEEHIFDNVEVATDSTLTEPARRLLALVQAEDLGIERELYRTDTL